MATVGKLILGSSTKDLANYAYSIQVTLNEDGDITHIDVGLSSPTTDANVSAAILSDVAGAPGVILRDTDEVLVTATPGFYRFTLDSPLSQTAGPNEDS